MTKIPIKPIHEQESFALERVGYASPITDDEVEIHFEKGIFYITKNINLFFDGCKKVKITGCGEDTKIYFGEKTNFSLDDDSVIKISGSEEIPVSVTISDLVISYDKCGSHEPLDKDGKEYSGTNLDFDNKELYLIKCYYVKGFTMTNVKTELEDLKATNLDFRDCADVDIHDCTFVNYNRCTTGGCLWMQGNVENVSVHDNVFRKHGNDELLAVWNNGKKTNMEYTEDQFVTMRGINFSHNKIYYRVHGDVPNKDWVDLCNVLLTVSTNQEPMKVSLPGSGSNVGTGGIGIGGGSGSDIQPLSSISGSTDIKRQKICHSVVADVELCDNDIYICSPVNQVLRLAFDRHTKYSNIKVCGNNITHTEWSFVGEKSTTNVNLCDFAVYYDMEFAALGIGPASDGSFCNEPVMICGNNITSRFKPRPGVPNDTFVCVDAGGANVRFEGNFITDQIGPVYGKNNSTDGLTLLQSGDLSSRFFLKDNCCRGLHCLASLKSERKNVFVDITAVDNMFEGDTRVFCNTTSRVLNMTANFSRNRFCSDYLVFFLQDFARQGVVRFKENYVERRVTNVSEQDPKRDDVYMGALVSFSDHRDETNQFIKVEVDSMLVVCRDNAFVNMTMPDSNEWGYNIYSQLMDRENVTLRHSDNYYKGAVD